MPDLPVKRSSIRREASQHSRALFDSMYALMLQEVTTLQQLRDWTPAGLVVEQTNGVYRLERKK
ncbi:MULTISPECIES: hypothetical protein [Cupriavidus]